MKIIRGSIPPIATPAVTGSRGRRLGAVTLIVGLAITGATAVVPESASADAPSPPFAQAGNASDPFAFRCHSGSKDGYCMVTSQDLNLPPIDNKLPGENYYPMERTQGFWSENGISWSPSTTAVNEQVLGRSGFQHLWAPAVRWVKNGSGPVPPHEYYLYTPDLTNKADKYSSRIFVSYSTNPTAGYGTANISGTSTRYREISGAAPGYMSDPEVFVDDAQFNTPSTSNQYLLWADGDNASCGGMSLRRMTGHTSVQPFTSVNEAWLTIEGDLEGELGTCVKTAQGTGGGGVDTDVHRPYLEGGSIFRRANWQSSANHSLPGPYVLMFAAKPSKVPAACAAGGQPNSPNEVIAYATASSVTGPYTYQGIIMCGSDTEWTNQATVEEVNLNGRSQLVLVYHDGVVSSNDARNRKLHAECLLTDGNGKFLLTSRSPEGAATTGGTPQWCLSRTGSTQMIALKSASTGRYVISRTDTQLTATSDSVGLWEQFALNVPDKSSTFSMLARNPGNLWVQVNRNAPGKPVIARGASAGSWEGLHPVSVPGQPGMYRISDNEGYYWRADSAGNISAATNNPSSGDQTYWFKIDYLW